jgi:arylsulfatase A-like enzyme
MHVASRSPRGLVTSALNILMIVTDEERFALPAPTVSNCPHGSGSRHQGSRSHITMRPPPCAARRDQSSTPAAICRSPRSSTTTTCRTFGRWRDGLNFYLNCIRDVDRSVELVLDALVASGQADRTIVIFTADHGDMAGSHGLRQKGNLVYDENFHVPLIIRHPDVVGGTETSSLASGVDLVPTLLDFGGVDVATTRSELRGRSLGPALERHTVRDGVLAAVEAVTNIDAEFWSHFSDPNVGERILSGELRPDWRKRGFLRAFMDKRYTFGRYFSPLLPNRPRSVDELFTNNDVVLYDRATDPFELDNLASDLQHRSLVAECLTKLESLITTEIGEDEHVWVAERPQLLGWPIWRGDAAA